MTRRVWKFIAHDAICSVHLGGLFAYYCTHLQKQIVVLLPSATNSLIKHT